MRLADEIGCASGSQPSLFFSDTSDTQLQAAATELAQRFHDGLGTHSRRVAYSFLLQEPELLFESFEDNCGRRQTAVMRALWPVTKGACTVRRAVRAAAAGRGSCPRPPPMRWRAQQGRHRRRSGCPLNSSVSPSACVHLHPPARVLHAAPHYAALHCTVLYCTALRCTALHCTLSHLQSAPPRTCRRLPAAGPDPGARGQVAGSPAAGL